MVYRWVQLFVLIYLISEAIASYIALEAKFILENASRVILLLRTHLKFFKYAGVSTFIAFVWYCKVRFYVSISVIAIYEIVGINLRR